MWKYTQRKERLKLIASLALPVEIKALRGQLLVEAVFAKWGAGTCTVPWLNEAGERNVWSDEVNRPIMESLCESYVDPILESGLNVDCSGHGGCGWVDLHSGTQGPPPTKRSPM